MWDKFRTFAEIKSNIKGEGMRSTAKDIMEIYKSSNKDEIAEYFPLLMNERLNCIFQKSIEPKTEDYQEVADMLNGMLELNIEAGHVKVLLDFYPYVKAKIAHNPATDEMMRDLILDAVSDFFLGCPWPEYEENVNMDDYLDVLSVQFKGFSTGFEITSQLIINQHQQAQDLPAVNRSNEGLSEMSNQDTVAALASAYAEENDAPSVSLSFEAKETHRDTKFEQQSISYSEEDGEEDKVILSPKTYKEINGHLNLFGEDMLPPEEIDKILGDEYIKSQIVAWGIDTVVRDNLFEIFVGYFLPEKYSEYGISYQETSDKLDEAVKAYVKAFKEKTKKDLQS